MAHDSVSLREAGPIVLDLVAAIQREQGRLSEIDGATGDGDHGVNMGKGFRLAGAKLEKGGAFDLAQGLATLGDTLLGDIGGSMGPLYGTFFTDMAEVLGRSDRLDRARFGTMLHAGLDAVCGLGEAKVGDKTLVDVLAPAADAFDAAAGRGEDFAGCLAAMKAALGAGALEAATLDAGAASCNLLLGTLADGLLRRLEAGA